MSIKEFKGNADCCFNCASSSNLIAAYAAPSSVIFCRIAPYGDDEPAQLKPTGVTIMSIKFSNIVSLLETAAAGKPLYVVNADTELDGVRINPVLDRFWEDDVITTTRVNRVVADEKDMPAGVYAKSMRMIMDLADNVKPVVRYGAHGWELDNAEGRLVITPENALLALSEVRKTGLVH